MALSQKAKEYLTVALANKKIAEEVSGAIDAGSSQAANVAPIADPSTATAEDAANKINAVIASLVAAGVMKSS